MAVTITISAFGAVIAAIGIYLKVRADDKARAGLDAQIERMAPWFEEDKDHDSLPAMVKALLRGQQEHTARLAEFGERLSNHLRMEEQDVRVINDRLSAIEEHTRP